MSVKARKPKLDFKLWEKALIALAAALFGTAFYLYVTDYPLKRYLFGIEDEGSRQAVGVVGASQGMLRRQMEGEPEFKSVHLNDPLFNEDTVVTGPESMATLRLEDGTAIELAPGTMIRLRFETELSLGGISRAASIDVVTGRATATGGKGTARIRESRHAVAPPLERRPVRVASVPVPAPVEKSSPPPELVRALELVAPRPGAKLALAPGAKALRKDVALGWRVSPPGRPLVVVLSKIVSSGAGRVSRKELRRETVADHGGAGALTVTLNSPGQYEWELQDPRGMALPGKGPHRAAFTLSPDAPVIELLDPLVGGEPLVSNKLSGTHLRNFDIAFRWKPVRGVRSFRVVVRTAPDAKPVIEQETTGESFRFNKDRVYDGQIYYEIKARTPEGFVLRSPLTAFSFSFLAPSLVMPANHTRLTLADLAQSDHSVLLTWQKTNFTDGYEIEVARDAAFAQTLRKERIKENFLLLRSPAPGVYYWRVRGFAGKVLSPYSAPFDLTISR